MAALKENELACKDAGMIECRADPLRIAWSFDDLSTSDKHAVNCRFSCSLQIADNPSDRKMFAEVFLSARDTVTSELLAAHFAPAIRSALQSISSNHEVAKLVHVSATEKTEWINKVRAAADPVAFAAGLELLPPFQLDIESPSLQRESLEQMSRARAEARAAGQVQHLQRATELLKQFQEMRRSAPDLPAGKLLEQLSAADRGLALQTLLTASAESNKRLDTSLWAVSGNALVQIDLHATPPRVKVIPIPDTLGPLRSVQSTEIDGQTTLLLGARGGILAAPLQNPANVKLFIVPNLQSQLGFNAAIQTGNMLWASHSEAGIVGWNLNAPEAPAATYPETAVASSTREQEQSVIASGSLRTVGSGSRLSGARNLLPLDASKLIYSIGGELIIRTPQERTVIPAISPSEVISLIPTGHNIVAVYQDGTIGSFDPTTRELTPLRRRGTRLSAAAALPWLGELRLLLATDEGPIDCIGIEDSIVTEYLSPYRGLKILTATESHIAAVSPDRQRIIIWPTSDPHRPAGEVHITSQTRHRIADIQFVSSK